MLNGTIENTFSKHVCCGKLKDLKNLHLFIKKFIKIKLAKVIKI